jgi:hypothetical protein
LAGWSASPAIRLDQPNLLTVMANGDHFVFMINDQLVAELQDDQIKSGITGLAVELSYSGVNGVVEFDNVELLAPK